MTLVLRLIRPTAAVLGTLVGGALLTSCAGIGVSGDRDLLVRDMYEVKQNLNEYIKNQAETDRKTTYQLSALDENVQKNGTISKSSIDELEKRVREQNEELTAIKAQLEELKYAVDGVAKRGSSGTVFTPAAGTDPFSGGGEVAAADGEAGAPVGGGGSVDQLLDSSKRQFMLGNYDAAKQGLDATLALNPEGDQKVEVYFYLGETAMGTKDLTAAENSYFQAIKAKPNHDKAWVSLERMADINAQRGDSKKAVAMLEQIVTSKPSYPDIDRVKQKITDLQGGGAAQ